MTIAPFAVPVPTCRKGAAGTGAVFVGAKGGRAGGARVFIPGFGRAADSIDRVVVGAVANFAARPNSRAVALTGASPGFVERDTLATLVVRGCCGEASPRDEVVERRLLSSARSWVCQRR